MSTVVIGREYLIGAVIATAPQLKEYFEYTLIKTEYTISELNALFRYEVIRLANGNTMRVREWLCESLDGDVWLYYFCRHVVPLLSRVLSHYEKPSDRMFESIAG